MSRADANAFLDAVSASIRRGDRIDPEHGRISFADYAVLWLAQRTDIRPRTREQYGLLIENKLIPAFGQHELAKITPLDVRSWYADIAGKTPGSARSAYRLFKSDLQHRDPRRPHREEPLPGPIRAGGPTG